MKAVILAGGLGSRLRPFTQIIPKPLLPVGEKSVLEIQIDHLKKHGFTEIYFAANYKSDLMESYFGDGSKYGVRIHFSLEEKQLGTCGPISLLRERLHEPFVVVNGDILTNLHYGKAVAFHLERQAILTVVAKQVTFPLSYGNLSLDGDRVLGIQEKPDLVVNIVAGIYVMSPSVFEFIPYNERFGMDELMNKMLAARIPIYRYQMEEYWLDIGRMEDYQKAQEDVKIHFPD